MSLFVFRSRGHSATCAQLGELPPELYSCRVLEAPVATDDSDFVVIGRCVPVVPRHRWDAPSPPSCNLRMVTSHDRRTSLASPAIGREQVSPPVHRRRTVLVASRQRAGRRATNRNGPVAAPRSPQRDRCLPRAGRLETMRRRRVPTGRRFWKTDQEPSRQNSLDHFTGPVEAAIDRAALWTREEVPDDVSAQ